ncbi:uncharacterized protein DDB_G0288805-like [Leptopilina heterotoma]|uniref:uncharacterized protein DDB_G0288805-like n=1 Tax=Leptopilina heterotoma TaxID=63436 RepID=UPI001CA82E03|nr:uncharacterized protein DDB_G0288805-like [Leptopilina heterotoma]
MFATFKTILCIVSVISILETTAENAVPCFQKESKEIRDSNQTKSSETEIESDNSTNLELPKLIVNSTQNISKNLTDETEINKSVNTANNITNTEQTIEDKNSSSTTEYSIKENTDNLIQNISERTLPILNSTVEKLEKNNNEETTKIDGNATINLNSNTNDSENKNCTELEKNQKNLTNLTEIITSDTEKSATNTTIQENKEKRQSQNENNSEDNIKNEEVFLKAFKNCELLVGERFLRMGIQNPEKIRKCVFDELKKAETFNGEYTKFLDNSKFIRKL